MLLCGGGTVSVPAGGAQKKKERAVYKRQQKRACGPQNEDRDQDKARHEMILTLWGMARRTTHFLCHGGGVVGLTAKGRHVA